PRGPRPPAPSSPPAPPHAAYEAATKRIADAGWWELEDRNERRFVFVLPGRSGSDRYALITTAPDALLHLLRDSPPSLANIARWSKPDDGGTGARHRAPTRRC